MRPRSKLQFQVLGLSESLVDIKDIMLSWAKADCMDHKGFETKSRVVCMECGQKFPPGLVSRKRAVCPHCDTKIKVEKTRRTTDKQHRYVAIADISGEFQIIRNFEIYAYYKVGEFPRYSIYEILQHWILPTGKHEVVARNHTVNWYVDSWNGGMEIRKGTYRKSYDVYPFKLHPASVFCPELRRYGIDHNLRGITSLEAIQNIPKNPMMETLLKARQYQLLGFAMEEARRAERYWPSMRICIRNKYVVKDAKMWVDYLDLLSYFRKDLLNAHYVCPGNLKREHDKWMVKKRLRQEREEAERKREKAIKDERRFRELKARFFGIFFSDGELQVRMIESVEEFMMEGDAMHHCVFTNEYYLKKDSLILSARIGDKRVETVEVSLKKLDVVQSRGVCNKNTEYHDRIVELVRRNMDLIRKRMTA